MNNLEKAKRALRKIEEQKIKGRSGIYLGDSDKFCPKCGKHFDVIEEVCEYNTDDYIRHYSCSKHYDQFYSERINPFYEMIKGYAKTIREDNKNR